MSRSAAALRGGSKASPGLDAAASMTANFHSRPSLEYSLKRFSRKSKAPAYEAKARNPQGADTAARSTSKAPWRT